MELRSLVARMSAATSGTALEWSPDIAALIRATGLRFGEKFPRPSLRAQRSNPSFVARGDNGLLRCARNDGGYSFAFSRRMASEVCYQIFHPLGQRAQGRPGARRTHGPVCNLRITTRTRAYRFGGSIPAFPAQWLYGLLRALPGERLFCLRRQRDRSRQLNASTAAPEPHDFTVRLSRSRQSQLSRPSHLTARS